MKCTNVAIVNKLGLHARASAKLVSLATRFKAEITVSRNGQEANCKSIMGVMMLAAAKGSQLQICAKGKDEAKAIAALAELVGNRFGEDE